MYEQYIDTSHVKRLNYLFPCEKSKTDLRIDCTVRKRTKDYLKTVFEKEDVSSVLCERSL